MLGLVCTRRLRSLNWGWCRSASSAPLLLLLLLDVDVGAAAPEDDPAAEAEMPGGIPFIKNSTATSGLPLDARRHARQSDSGKPSALRLLITSVGNSSLSEALVVVAVVAAADCVDGAVAAVAVAAAGVVVAAAAVASVVDAVAAAAATGGAAATAAGFASSFGAAAFFALAIMTTKKSDGLILQLSIVASSLRTLPEWINFMLAAGSSDLVVSMTALVSATVLDGSTSMVNLPPLSVFTVSCMVI
mmetsp:Transcript_21330/g.34909  ORF Transcript_21330/g.34909 Transcript_21330/m.34909 type:complete len:246 (-) Transcript_21330:76-813(-)